MIWLNAASNRKMMEKSLMPDAPSTAVVRGYSGPMPTADQIKGLISDPRTETQSYLIDDLFQLIEDAGNVELLKNNWNSSELDSKWVNNSFMRLEFENSVNDLYDVGQGQCDWIMIAFIRSDVPEADFDDPSGVRVMNLIIGNVTNIDEGGQFELLNKTVSPDQDHSIVDLEIQFR